MGGIQAGNGVAEPDSESESGGEAGSAGGARLMLSARRSPCLISN